MAHTEGRMGPEVNRSDCSGPHRFADISSIALLRGGGIGDLCLALPGAQALRAAYPGASITLLGTESHRSLVHGRCPSIDDVMVLPPFPGVHSSARGAPAVDEEERGRRAQGFFDEARARHFDLGVQLHGGGANSNPFLLRCGVRHSVGPATRDARQLERTMRYQLGQHDIMRACEVAALAGAEPNGLRPVLAATQADLNAADARLGATARASGGRAAPLIVMHVGATDPTRRWPAAAFARLAAHLVRDGVRVVLVGEHGESGIAETVVAEAAARVGGRPIPSLSNLVGETTMGQLVGMLARADVVVGNDSGPRHVAEALGTRTASVYLPVNAVNAAPLTRRRHRVRVAWAADSVAAIPWSDVYEDVTDLLNA